jgi:type VI secretion system secreted protein Hcp
MRTREHLIWAGAAVAIAGLVSGLTHAGNLNPAGGPAPTMTTLDDIGQLAAATSGFVPATVPDAFRGPAYMQIEIGGVVIEGEDTVLGARDVIQLFGYEAGAAAPFDASTGQPTGVRRYQPIVIRKRIDKATPLLLDAFSRNQVVTEATFRFFRPSGTGMQHYFTVTLTNGRIASVNHSTSASTDPSEPVTEEVGIVFQTITWEHIPSGATAGDDWGTNPA